MKCSVCGSEDHIEFPAEICIHFPELEDLHKTPVLVFPTVSICPYCGGAEFVVPEAELRALVNAESPQDIESQSA